MNIKTVIILALALLAVGCGGGRGGSGNSGDSDRQACQSYCSYACGKAVQCAGGGTPANVTACSDECFSTIVEQGSLDGDTCRDTSAQIAALSCHELLTFLGLLREGKIEGSIGEQCGLSAR